MFVISRLHHEDLCFRRIRSFQQRQKKERMQQDNVESQQVPGKELERCNISPILQVGNDVSASSPSSFDKYNST